MFGQRPAHAPGVSGRKSDEGDAEWIQRLHAGGLLSSCFLPDDLTAALCTLVRHRRSLLQDSARYGRRMQKALEEMNIKVHSVLRATWWAKPAPPSCRPSYPDTAAAIENSSIAFIPKTDFREVLNTSKVFAHQLLKTLSHEFYVFVNSVALIAQRSVRERFAVQLVLMREKYKQNFLPGREVEINMSREDWANLVGTARENIVRILKDFKEEGILETRGRKIIVRNISRL